VLGKVLEENAATFLGDGKVVAKCRIDKADFNVAAPQKARKMILAFRQCEDLRERHHEGVVNVALRDLSEQVLLDGIKPGPTF